MTCQSGFHDQGIPHKLHSQIINFGNDIMNTTLCDVCFSTISEANEKGEDLTMSTIYQWGKELGNPHLPESLRKCFRNCAEIAHFVNGQLNDIRQRMVNCNIFFPYILKSINEKYDFIRSVSMDQITIGKNLLDVTRGNDKGSIALRLYAGCLDAAKSTRDSHNSAIGFIEYTPEKRFAASMTVKAYSDQDPVYAAGAKSALPLELLFNGHKTRFLEKIPVDSIIRESLKARSRNKDVVTLEDIVTVI